MKKLFRNVFGVYPNEKAAVFRFTRLALIWSFGSSMSETLSMGLFLEKIGPHSLPMTYLFTALGMIGVSSLFLHLFKTVPTEKIFLGVLFTAACFYAFTAFTLLFAPVLWFWILLQIFSYIFMAATITCFWNLLDQYHDLQEAKRIYAIYNAAYFLGAILSGFFINQFVSFFGVSCLYAFVSLSLFFAIRETKLLLKTVHPIDDVLLESVFSGEKKTFFSILYLFCKSPFALFLVAMSLSIQLLRTSTEFSYMDAFAKLFHSDSMISLRGENTLPEFLGKCKALIAIGNIFLGFFFYRRFVRRLGLGNVLLISPLFFLSIYSGWMFSHSFLLAILGMIAVEGILFSVGENSFNLLLNAAPSKLKGSLRIINDSFFEPVGMLFSSIFLLCFQSENQWFGLCLSLLFLVFSFFIRKLYPKTIFMSLKQNIIHFEKKGKDWFFSFFDKKEQKESREILFKSLQDPSEEISLFAYQTLLSLKDHSILLSLLARMDALNPERKISLLKLLEESFFSSHPKILEKVLSWSLSEDNTLKKWAKLYLAKKSFSAPSEKSQMSFTRDDLFTQASEILTVTLSPIATPAQKLLAKKEWLSLLNSSSEQKLLMGIEILIAEKSLEAANTLLSFLSHPSLKIRQTAAQVFANIADRSLLRFTEKILEELRDASDSKLRLSFLEILGKIGDSTTVKEIILLTPQLRPHEKRLSETILLKMGLKIVPSLLTIIKDKTVHDRSRLLAGKILGLLALPQLQANLLEILTPEIQRAYFYFFYGHTLQKHYPNYDLSLLSQALLSGLQSVLDFIIYLLGTAGSIENCDLLVSALHHKNTKAHADAIETLEKNCHTKIFNQIRPLFDDIPHEERFDFCLHFQQNHPKLSLIELLDQLDHSPSLFEKAVAAHLKAKFQMPNWQASLKKQIKIGSPFFHHFAYELLETP